MAASVDTWIFTKEQLENTPSRRCNIDSDKELYYRQQAATLIQEMGQRLQVTQLCINTAIVYLHRFYMFHSFTKFHRNPIAACAVFLAAKVEEQPRKLEHVIRVAHMILFPGQRNLDVNSEQYLEQAQELINNENILLQTLGFDVAIDHPHTQVLKCCQHLFRASGSKDMAQTSYFMATNSLHLTTMCLQYKPTVVACVCIHLVCKWFNYEVPLSGEGKEWYTYVDKTVTLQLLDQLTVDFLAVFNKCPSRLRKRVMQQPGLNASAISDRSASSAHSDTHRSSSSSSAAGQGDRNARPHDQRRDRTTSGAPVSSSGSSGHRPSTHPPAHASRPPEGGSSSGGGTGSSHHHQPNSGHSSRPPHPHQRPSSNSVKDPKQSHTSGNAPHGSSSSSSQHLQPQPVPSSRSSQQQQPHSQHSSSTQQRKPSAPPSTKVPLPVGSSSSTGSLFSPPRVDQHQQSQPQQQQQPERRPAFNPAEGSRSNSKPPSTSFSQDWSVNGSLVGNAPSSQPLQQQQQTQQQSISLGADLGFSFDMDEADDQDSTWDINYGMEPSSLLSSPNAAIESMLSSSGQGANQQQQSIFSSLLAPSPKFQQPVQQQQMFPSTPQMTNASQLPNTPQLAHTPQLANTPQLISTTPQQPVVQQMLHHQLHRESLFDVDGFGDSMSNVNVKMEDTFNTLDIKSTPVAEVIVGAAGGPPESSATEESAVDPSASSKKKKKKKEKHKNKDKDRDKEHKEKEKEKKHKKHKDKDKERDKDKHKDRVGSDNKPPVLKLKIPIGRIEGTDSASAANGSSAGAQAVLPAGGLKIKISREALGSSSGASGGTVNASSLNAGGGLASGGKDKSDSGRKRSSTTSSSSLNRALPSAKIPKMEALVQQQQQSQQMLHPSQQQVYQQQQQQPLSQQQQQQYQNQLQNRPYHERNGSSGTAASLLPQEDRDGRQRSQSATHHRSAGPTPVKGNSQTSFNTSAANASVVSSANSSNAYNRGQQGYPPAFAPAYPPPGHLPPMAQMQPMQQNVAPQMAQGFYNPFPPAYPYHMYPPYQQGPPPMPMMNTHTHPPPPMATGGIGGMPPLPREPPPQVPPPPPPQSH